MKIKKINKMKKREAAEYYEWRTYPVKRPDGSWTRKFTQARSDGLGWVILDDGKERIEIDVRARRESGRYVKTEYNGGLKGYRYGCVDVAEDGTVIRYRYYD